MQLTVELWQISFSRQPRSPSKPLAADVDKSQPLNSSTFNLANDTNDRGVGSLAGGGRTETTFKEVNSPRILLSCSSAR